MLLGDRIFCYAFLILSNVPDSSHCEPRFWMETGTSNGDWETQPCTIYPKHASRIYWGSRKTALNRNRQRCHLAGFSGFDAPGPSSMSLRPSMIIDWPPNRLLKTQSSPPGLAIVRHMMPIGSARTPDSIAVMANSFGSAQESDKPLCPGLFRC